MMIDLESKSYPYLAIAQWYSLDYGLVLALADAVRKTEMTKVGTGIQYDVWEQRALDALWNLEINVDAARRIRNTMLKWIKDRGS